MLPANFRFIIYNSCGQTLDFDGNSANETATVDFLAYQRHPTRLHILPGGSKTTLTASADIADGGTEALTAQEIDGIESVYGRFAVTTDNASADGDVILGIEFSVDGGTTWPSASTNWDAGEDMHEVCRLTLGGAHADAVDFLVDANTVNGIATVYIAKHTPSLDGAGAPTVDSFSTANVSAAADTADQELVAAPGANKQIWVYSFIGTADTADGSISLQDESDTAVSGVMEVSQRGGVAMAPSGNFAMPWAKLATNKALEIDTVTCGFKGILTYAVVDVS